MGTLVNLGLANEFGKRSRVSRLVVRPKSFGFRYAILATKTSSSSSSSLSDVFTIGVNSSGARTLYL